MCIDAMQEQYAKTEIYVCFKVVLFYLCVVEIKKKKRHDVK